MAKSKNHTNHNQNRKAHRNGIKKAKRYRMISTVGKDDEKLRDLDVNKVLGISGSVGDRTKFSDYVIRNMHLNKIRQGFSMSIHACASFARTELASYLREDPLQLQMLLAGVDDAGPRLYWIDYLGSIVELPKAAHGYASHFILGILDRYYKPDLTEEEALDICEKCIKELKERFILSQTEFSVKIVQRENIKRVKLEC